MNTSKQRLSERELSNLIGKDIKIVNELDGASFSQNFFCILDGQKVFIKYLEDVPHVLPEFEETVRIRFAEYLLTHLYRKPFASRTSPDQINLEASVLKKWNELNLSSPQLLDTDFSSYLIESFSENALPISHFLERGLYTSKIHASVMDTLSSLRLASSARDVLLLHNDLHPENLLYLLDTSETQLIDPGLLFKEDKSFEELDAYFNLFFLYSLQQRKYASSPKAVTKISRHYLSLLDPSTLEFMLELNTYISSEDYAFIEQNGSCDIAEWWGLFTKPNYNKVNDLIYRT